MRGFTRGRLLGARSPLRIPCFALLLLGGGGGSAAVCAADEPKPYVPPESVYTEPAVEPELASCPEEPEDLSAETEEYSDQVIELRSGAGRRRDPRLPGSRPSARTWSPSVSGGLLSRLLKVAASAPSLTNASRPCSPMAAKVPVR